MGILNITPDSFSDGGIYYNNIEEAVAHAKTMLSGGADIIDIGGESTRPGAEPITAEVELQRVIPVIKAVRKNLGNKFTISIDTYKSEVAQAALTSGASMINCMGGFTLDKNLTTIAAQFGCPVMIYHIKCKPKTQGKVRDRDIMQEVIGFFEVQIAIGVKNGMRKEQFILDPGIGAGQFGKNIEQNLEIIRRLHEFINFGLPIAIGVSRKSHLGLLLQKDLNLPEPPPPSELLAASLAETAVAILNGASIVRTHDVAETKQFVTVLDNLK